LQIEIYRERELSRIQLDDDDEELFVLSYTAENAEFVLLLLYYVCRG
jgi:hypothetical protein